MSKFTTVNLLENPSAKPVGCRIYRGELIPEPSPEFLGDDNPEGIIYACHSECVNRFFVCDGAHVYTSASPYGFVKLAALKSSIPFMLEDVYKGKPTAIVIGGANSVYHDGLSHSGVLYGANLKCGVLRCGRLFGIDAEDGYKLVWSGTGGARDWNQDIHGGGHIILDPAYGEASDIISFGEKIVAVRKYGLTVLNMFGSPENFAGELRDTPCDGAVARTACVVSGRLLFYTQSGLHAFDGSSVTCVPHRFSEDIQSPVYAMQFAGRYYLLCTSKSLERKVVFVYDCNLKESFLIDFPADAICASDTIYLFNADGSFKLTGEGSYTFTVEGINFGSAKNKTVSKMLIGGVADAEISNGRILRRAEGASGIIRPRLRGESFTVKLIGKTGVNALTATAEEANGI